MRGWERRQARLPARHRAAAGVGQVGELGRSGVGSLDLLLVQATPPPLGSTVASSQHHPTGLLMSAPVCPLLYSSCL